VNRLEQQEARQSQMLSSPPEEDSALGIGSEVMKPIAPPMVKRQAAGERLLPVPVAAFEPYVMRHTALTRMAPSCDAFTLARIAGHCSITITQRYCHPQADEVELHSRNSGIAENWSPRLVTAKDNFPLRLMGNNL
jgi:hypothetical protein